MKDRIQIDNPDSLLAALRSKEGGARGAECPDDGIWFELAAGVADPEIERRALTHAAGCDYCGALLRDAIRDLSEDQPPKVTPAPVEIRAVRKTGRQWWAWAAAAALLATATGSWIIGKPSYFTWRARTLLAESQKEARYTPFRLAGAPYARTVILRGTASEADKLVEAADIARQAGSGVKAGLVQARIQLAAGRSGDAAARLEGAISADGETAELENDLGVAFAEMGDNAGLLRALDAFDRALARDPSFAPALYNRALVLSMMGRKQEACTAAAAFLAAEKDESWRREMESAISCSQ